MPGSPRRTAQGVKGSKLTEKDSVRFIQNCHTHDSVIFFTTEGKVYSTAAHCIVCGGPPATHAPSPNSLYPGPCKGGWEK